MTERTPLTDIGELRISLSDRSFFFKPSFAAMSHIGTGAEIVEISLPHTDYAISAYYLIAPAEAMELFRYAGIQEVHIAKDLHDFYRAQKGRHSDSLWDMMSLLSFVYDTGRVQGMREERAKRKERYNG